MPLTKRQQQIVGETISLIAEQGIQGFTIKNLAQRIGVTEPALYRHFSGKSAILDAMIDEFDRVSSEVMQAARGTGRDPVDCIGRFLEDRYHRFAADPAMGKVMLSEEFFQNDERLAGRFLAMMHGHKATIDIWVAEAQTRGLFRNDIDATQIFRLIFGPMRLLAKQWYLSRLHFDLVREGMALWQAQKRLLAGPALVQPGATAD